MGESYYEIGDYASAARFYQSYLDTSPAPANHDRALFRLALMYLFPESPLRDQPLALEMLQKLVADFPQSLHRPEAEFLLRLHQEAEGLRSDLSKRDQRIKELTQELERLKQIDMQRRPSRPPP
ncbi:MAG: tetratricopeptide repeat protein [Acidobacteria bacterium]|nr:tetratricopeptide repeat protein [Acidobacteriota bacterium]